MWCHLYILRWDSVMKKALSLMLSTRLLPTIWISVCQTSICAVCLIAICQIAVRKLLSVKLPSVRLLCSLSGLPICQSSVCAIGPKQSKPQDGSTSFPNRWQCLILMSLLSAMYLMLCQFEPLLRPSRLRDDSPCHRVSQSQPTALYRPTKHSGTTACISVMTISVKIS